MRPGNLAVLILTSWHLLLPADLPAQAGELRVGGRVEALGTVYPKDAAEDAYGEVRFRPTVSYVPSEMLLLYVEGDFRADSAGYAQGHDDDIVQRSGERPIAGIREAYLDYRYKWLNVRLGEQIFDWSVTDTISPSDNLSPRDWTDILEAERTGVPAVSLRAGYNTYAQVVYVPWFTPSILPARGGRWDRDLPPWLVRGEQDIADRDKGQGAVRFGTSVRDFDLGVAYYRGYAYSPSTRLTPTREGFLELAPVYRFEEVYSASAATSLGSFNLRAEIGYFRQRDEDDFIQYVSGIDREWGGLLRPVDTLYVLVQYVNETVTEHDNPVGLPTIDFRRVLNNSLLVKAHYSLDSERQWTIKLEGSYNFGDRDSFIEPAVVWRKRSLEVESGIDILWGNPNTFFGGYRKNDRLYVKTTYRF